MSNAFFNESAYMPNCSQPSIDDFPADLFTQYERATGAIVLHLVGVIYACYGISVICDLYFVPSLEKFAKQFKLSPDVAGATLMAAATSSPEFFTSLIGIFITKSDIGTGTIVGSAVFNILAVPCLCGLLSGQIVLLNWWPLSRDCICYLISVIALVVIMVDEKIYWYESAVLMLLFLFYILIMIFNEKLESICRNLFGFDSSHDDFREGRKINSEETEMLYSPDSDHSHLTNEEDDNNDDSFSPKYFPSDQNLFFQCFYCIKYPILLLFYCTIPNIGNDRCRSCYPITFIISVIYIGGLSYFVTWMIAVMGYTMGLPDVVMGLTFLAFGTSVPEGFSSIIVCKKGYGNMALSNSIGSNVFDILICLGIPWFIKALLSLSSSSPYGYVKIQSHGLLYLGTTLIATIAILFLVLLCFKFRLNLKVGLIVGVFYILFLTFAICIELLLPNVNLRNYCPPSSTH